jgi:hypothetical protein
VIITTRRIRRTFTSKINLHSSQSGADSISSCAQRSCVEVAHFQFEATSLCSVGSKSICAHVCTTEHVEINIGVEMAKRNIVRFQNRLNASTTANSLDRQVACWAQSQDRIKLRSILMGQETSLVCCVHSLIFFRYGKLRIAKNNNMHTREDHRVFWFLATAT